MNKNPAGSATGFDLATINAKLECVSRWIDRFPVPTTGATRMMMHLSEVQNALLSATPQHSVTEQASIDDYTQFHALLGNWLAQRDYYQDDEAELVKAAWAKFIAYIDSRAQPLASTAATQPEQASELPAGIDPLSPAYIKPWAQRMFNPGNRNIQTAMEAEIADLRAALAIPASTAPADQENEQANVAPPFAAPAGQHEAIVSAIVRGWWSTAPKKVPAGSDLTLDDDVVQAVAREVGVTLASRFRAQGGSTNTDSTLASTATSEQQAGADERVLFETWFEAALRRTYPHMPESGVQRMMSRHVDGTYTDMTTQHDWSVWQASVARAALTHRATTAADQQGAAQAQAGDVARWTSVKDQLPETRHECTSRDMMVSDSFYVRGVALDGGEGFGMADYQDNGKWHCYGGDYDFMHIVEVTHYLPARAAMAAPSTTDGSKA